MQLVDVLNKLRELEKTNESVKDAIDSAKRMNGEDNLTEAQRLYSVKLENDKGVTKNVRVKAGSEQEAKDSATMDPKFKAVSARVVDAPADDEEDDDLEESFEQGGAEGAGQQLSVQQLAQISDAALDSAYGYGRSSPGNTFGWQANLASAAYAKQAIEKGVTDLMAISDAVHKGWWSVAQKFVDNPDQFSDTETLRAKGKFDKKMADRKAQMVPFNQLTKDQQDIDTVVARAMLQAITGKQGVAEEGSAAPGAANKEALAKQIYDLGMSIHRNDRMYSQADPEGEAQLAKLKAQFAQQFPGEDAFKLGSAISDNEYQAQIKQRPAGIMQKAKNALGSQESVAEGTYNADVERAFPDGKASGVKTGASAPKGTSTMPTDLKKAMGQPVGKEEEVAEGFKDMATELGQVADNKDYETLRDLIFSSKGEIGKYLDNMMQDFSKEKGLHPDDDYEELEHLVMDRLIHEFGNQFDEAATTEELNQIRKLSGFAEAKLDPVGKEDDDVNNDGEVDSTDDYLKNRREKIAKSMKESVDLTECGMMPENMGMMHNTPATVTMTATASSGSEVSSMLKDILTLAGQRSHADAYVMDGGCSMEEDGGFAAATSGPNEFEASVEQQLQQGDDMHKPHEQHAAMAKLGDNPMASEDVDQLAESLWQQFNATK